MTQADALTWIQGGWKSSPYAKTENGKLGIDVDNQNGFQCKDFVNAYADYLGAPFNPGNAITLINPQPGWTIETSPQPGDVFVANYVSGGVNYGHTGCVISVNSTGIISMDQNWLNSSLTVGSPPAQVSHPFSFVRTYQRFNFQGGNMCNPTSDQVGAEFQALAGRQPRQDELDLFVGLTWIDGQQQYLWPGVETMRQQNTDLLAQQTELYNFQNNICAALNLPVGSTSDECVAAIKKLEAGFTKYSGPQLYEAQ